MSHGDALRVARRFNAGCAVYNALVPEGRLIGEDCAHFQPSRWDESLRYPYPALKRRATFELSRWDNKDNPTVYLVLYRMNRILRRSRMGLSKIVA